MISDKTFKKFQEVIKQEYGKDLTDAEAREYLTNWTSYFDLLAKIHHRSVVRKEKEKKSVENNNTDKK